jgi:hypothetical protein
MHDDLANAVAGVCSLLVVGKSCTGVLAYYKILVHEEEAKKAAPEGKNQEQKEGPQPFRSPRANIR